MVFLKSMLVLNYLSQFLISFQPQQRWPLATNYFLQLYALPSHCYTFKVLSCLSCIYFLTSTYQLISYCYEEVHFLFNAVARFGVMC